MTRRVWVACVAAASGALLLIAPLAATAGGGGRVMIAERNVFTSGTTQSGTFHMAGALSDSGSATATFTITPSGDSRAFIDGDHVLTGQLGTLVVRTHAVVYPFPAPRAFVEGKWTVVSGTGAYAGMKGGGTVRAVGDFTNFTATIVREGAING